jgi:transcriptional regulator with XRE-family HTH domain
MLIDIEYNCSSAHVNNYSSLTANDCGYMVKTMKYGERLQKARNHAALTQKQLAEKINNVCTQENISKLERGNATGSEFTAQFANACGVRAMWLAADDGEMIQTGYSTSDPTLVEILKVLEARGDYEKLAAHKAVVTTAELVDHAAQAVEPGASPKDYRPPDRRRGLHFYGGPERRGAEKKNAEEK